MKIPSPLGQGGTSGGLDGVTNPPRRSATAVAARHPSDGGDFQERAFKVEHGSITVERAPSPNFSPKIARGTRFGEEEKIGWEGHPGLRELKSLAPPWAIVLSPLQLCKIASGCIDRDFR